MTYCVIEITTPVDCPRVSLVIIIIVLPIKVLVDLYNGERAIFHVFARDLNNVCTSTFLYTDIGIKKSVIVLSVVKAVRRLWIARHDHAILE